MILTRQKAITCLVVNQLVCPGVGTIMAGKRIGFVQAALMIVGFCTTLAWGLMYLSAAYKFAMNPFAREAEWKAMQPPFWMGVAGFGLCGLVWFWTLWVSLRLLHESRGHQSL